MLIGQRLRRWRDASDWSGPEAASKAATATVPVSWPDLRAFEVGERTPSAAEIDVLAAVYGRAAAELTGPESEADQPPQADPPSDTRPAELRDRSPFRPSARDTVVPEYNWHLLPGDTIRRTELHAQYGGSGRSGISPSNKSKNILLFSDPEAGEDHGYVDHWNAERTVFFFRGEGAKGDHQMIKGNRALRDHFDVRRRLRLFAGMGGEVQYAGQFELASPNAYLTETVPDPGTDKTRRIIIFRLVPFGTALDA